MAALWQFINEGDALIGNVMLCSYLVAILENTYGEGEDQGEFRFKANKYLYVERFSVA